MTKEQFDVLVDLMRLIAWREASASVHQPPAGSLEDSPEYFAARMVLENDHVS